MGLLRVRGKIELQQFWPEGMSDADTTKVIVTVGKNAFAFAEDGDNFRVTHVLDDAMVVGKSREAVVRNGKITVRLQGIDAPELHYKATALPRNPPVPDARRAEFNRLNRAERRQYWAETATMALSKKLGNFGTDKIDCEVISFVDAPHELVDTYGRVVGNVRVGNTMSTDVNVWLTEEAWVVPTFYSSMSEAEINTLLDAMRKGKRKGRVLRAISSDTSAFEEDLLFRKNGEPAPDEDKGPVLMPKLFRRQVGYVLQEKVGIFSGTFEEFLRKSPDHCFELDDFLKGTVHSATPRRLDEFIDNEHFTLKPHEVVFKEKFSSVVGPDGKRLEHF